VYLKRSCGSALEEEDSGICASYPIIRRPFSPNFKMLAALWLREYCANWAHKGHVGGVGGEGVSRFGNYYSHNSHYAYACWVIVRKWLN
jgi:hypothetical protein